MSPRNVIVVGAGKRVREAALPGLARLERNYVLRGVFGRSNRAIEMAGKTHSVRALDGLSGSEFRGTDLLYMAVGKPNVPVVLRRLAAFDVSATDLLIETPVLLLKHFRCFKFFKEFRNVWVAEDTAALPWYDVLRAAAPAIGEIREAQWHKSAYAYHGIAMSKAMLGSRVARARRVREKDNNSEATRILTFASGARAVITEPRDYNVGSFTFTGTLATVSDRPAGATQQFTLEPVITNNAIRGFRLGDFTSALDDDEAALCASPPAPGIVANMDSMKRVGFLRLLRSIAAGYGAYPLLEGLDDMVIDTFLAKIGVWASTPLSSAHSSAGRGALSLLSRLGMG